MRIAPILALSALLLCGCQVFYLIYPPQFEPTEMTEGYYCTTRHGEALFRKVREVPYGISIAHENALPPDVRRSLALLNEAIQSLPVDTARLRFRSSPNGRAVAAYVAPSGIWPETPTGVWVWPDWRRPDHVVSFPEFTEVQDFLSNRHLRLYHRNPTYSKYWVAIVDLSRPTARFSLRRGELQLPTLRLSDTGRWAGLKKDGSLYTGQLEAEDSLWNGQHVPIKDPVEELHLLRDGTVLVVETAEDTIRSFDIATFQELDRMTGQMHTVWCNESFLAWLPAQKLNAYVSVSHDGRLEPEIMPWVPAGEWPSFRPSPSCGFFLTAIPADYGKSSWQPTRNVRPTPTMRERTVAAKRRTSVSLPLERLGFIGWLAWD